MLLFLLRTLVEVAFTFLASSLQKKNPMTGLMVSSIQSITMSTSALSQVVEPYKPEINIGILSLCDEIRVEHFFSGLCPLACRLGVINLYLCYVLLTKCFGNVSSSSIALANHFTVHFQEWHLSKRSFYKESNTYRVQDSFAYINIVCYYRNGHV